MLGKMASISLFSCACARIFSKSVAFAICMVFAGLLTAGFIDPVHAQTVPEEKQEATEKQETTKKQEAAEKEKQGGAAGNVTTLPEMKISAERTDELPQPYALGLAMYQWKIVLHCDTSRNQIRSRP